MEPNEIQLTERAPLAVIMGGTDDLTKDSGFLVQQKFDLQELFCPSLQKRNRYKIRSDGNWNSDDAKSFEESPFESQPNKFFAKEESSLCCRVFCQNKREFEMFVRQGSEEEGPHQFKFVRPFRWACCCGPVMCQPNEIQVYDQNDKSIGSVVQDWRCCKAFMCKSYWKVIDNNNETQFVVRDDGCKGCNCCAPSCCVPVHEIDILDTQENPTDGILRNIFPGCNCKGLAGSRGMRDSYHLKFPSAADQQQRALLLASLFLIDYQMFENQGQDESV
mmetsp:Transcript_16091/g.31526  ORF Transcript_16091/g.31526 Transcript_16091/m.31526 type:complete len:276 (-) Transcript_16091:108-935(-)|eukprot:CAMPEP_0175151184 /NCGR_PEP_ID=MMETSP0087-20121206/18340_1 /TAXON_ID=136419 /ORGANISM="Unknown Unknown, Strain D1" /LENGTH=275 /DNA_ID=CAMNT_0016437323 /DNA_START=36 /DNA_END=863 /DNA_ORIENTATION=+